MDNKETFKLRSNQLVENIGIFDLYTLENMSMYWVDRGEIISL